MKEGTGKETNNQEANQMSDGYGFVSTEIVVNRNGAQRLFPVVSCLVFPWEYVVDALQTCNNIYYWASYNFSNFAPLVCCYEIVVNRNEAQRLLPVVSCLIFPWEYLFDALQTCNNIYFRASYNFRNFAPLQSMLL